MAFLPKLSEADSETLNRILGRKFVDTENFLTELRVKRRLSVLRIRETAVHYPDRFVCHSGGKDSVLVRALAEEAIPGIEVVHNPKISGSNTVHPLTVKFLYEETTRFPISFEPRLRSSGLSIDGTRRAEAFRDDGRSTDYISNGESLPRVQLPLFVEKGLGGLPVMYPIYNWSDEEVWYTILALKIPFSSEYLENL